MRDQALNRDFGLISCKRCGGVLFSGSSPNASFNWDMIRCACGGEVEPILPSTAEPPARAGRLVDVQEQGQALGHKLLAARQSSGEAWRFAKMMADLVPAQEKRLARLGNSLDALRLTVVDEHAKRIEALEQQADVVGLGNLLEPLIKRVKKLESLLPRLES